MSGPVLDGFAAELYDDRLAPWTTPDAANGYALAILCKALGAPWRDIDEIATTDDDGTVAWGRVLDVDKAPVWALPWLAMFAGVQLSGPLTEDQQRQRIKAHDATNRGTINGLTNAVKATLTGTQTVTVYERDGGAYRITVVTYTSETPDAAATEAAARAMKAAGLVMTYAAVNGWSIAGMESAFPPPQQISDLEGSAPDLATFEAH